METMSMCSYTFRPIKPTCKIKNPDAKSCQTRFFKRNLSLKADYNLGKVHCCVAENSSGTVGQILDGEEWRRPEKCREKKEAVEILECLETEAIMGDDVGKEPGDYDRRARIFDKSSRVFQALKQTQSSPIHNKV